VHPAGRNFKEFRDITVNVENDEISTYCMVSRLDFPVFCGFGIKIAANYGSGG
jgi:hypothetical protein